MIKNERFSVLLFCNVYENTTSEKMWNIYLVHLIKEPDELCSENYRQ